MSIRERSGTKSSMSLPWSLSRVHPPALGQEGQLSLPWSLSRVHPRALGQEGKHEFALEPLACPSASAQAGRLT